MSAKKVISTLKKPGNILLLILLAGFFLRFTDLGYSEFYGDETKTFYLDKTVPAAKFLLDQRKGPVQFAVVWVMEKVLGGYDSLFTRLPFVWAGFLSIIAFYIVVRRLFDQQSALLATSLFTLNGFFIAFSRTIQYQSFLVLFGLLAVYFVLLYRDEPNKKLQKKYLLLGAVFSGLNYLSHYDAVFFDAVIAFLLIRLILQDRKELQKKFKEIFVYYVIPSTVIAALFYVPYFIYGYYYSNTINYLARRLVGVEYVQNVSWYTFWVYNPSLLWPILGVFFVPFMLKLADWRRNLILFWFLVPFVVFQFIFTNPGTHISSYLIPLFIIVAVGIRDLYFWFEKKIYRESFLVFVLFAFGAVFFANARAFIPFLNDGYPWQDGVNKERHLFIYGFPYKRGWEQIAAYLEERGGVRKVYTNDNDTIAQYYLRGISYTEPGPNYLPPFYVHIFDNQEFVDIPVKFGDPNVLRKYEAEKEFFVNGEKTAVLYRLVE